MKHENKRTCVSCNKILTQAHRTLIQYAAYVRAAHPEAHVSCSFRGEADQNEAHNKGFSRLIWPLSKHNKTPARALDFFYLDGYGKAIWDAKFFKLALSEAAEVFGLIWGGRWSRPDWPHVEMPDSMP